MLIGIDFDNTIVCYDQAFYLAALDEKLIPKDLPPTKLAVRDYLRRQGQEERWTLLQGQIYGPLIGLARPFDGALAFFAACREAGLAVRVISHKTAHPYLGPPYDLRRAAAGWLKDNGFTAPGPGGLAAEEIFFEPTRQDKVRRIRETGCTHFLDDLPEFLAELTDIPGLTRILFDPEAGHQDTGTPRVRSYAALANLLLGRDLAA